MTPETKKAAVKAEALEERIARALAEYRIRTNRRWDTAPEKIEEMIKDGAADHAWSYDLDTARAVIAALPAPSTSQAGTPEGVRRTFEFDRFINGVLMAEDVAVERESNFADACVVAARIAPRGPNGEVPVLVLRAALHPAPSSEEGEKAVGDDETCTGCHGTGWDGMSERFCTCDDGAKAKSATLSQTEPQGGGAVGEPVAWQWRARVKGQFWDAWESGRFNGKAPPFMEIEERPLYAHPPLTSVSDPKDLEAELREGPTFADAIQFIQQRHDDYVSEHGFTDPATNDMTFPGNGDEYVWELIEIIEGLKTMQGEARK